MRHSLPTLFFLAAAILAASEAAAQDATLPARRAGYWQVILRSDAPGATAIKSEFCTDATVEQKVSVLGKSMMANVCSKSQVQHSLAGWTFVSVCKAGSMTIRTAATLSGDFQTHYHYDATMQMTPPLAPGLGNRRTFADGQWLGPCPPGRKPGDMVMPTGMVVNIVNLPTHK